MKPFSGYFYSIILIAAAVAQGICQSPEDSVDISSSSFSIALDYGKLLTLPSSFEKKAEVGFSWTSRAKWTLIGEVGYGILTPQDAIKNGSYESSGIYYRGGIGYELTVVPGSFLTPGVLFGQSNFEDKGNVVIRSAVWSDFEESFERTGLTANWIEFLLVTEQRLSGNWSLGTKLRIRWLLPFDNSFEPEVYSIPGYGRAFDASVPAANLFLKYTF